MRRRVRDWWVTVTTSHWVLPAAIVVAGVVLAAVLVNASAYVDDAMLARFPRLFGAGAAGARGMLSTIAGSMITVAGVTFSITIAAVAQTSAQYTPRVLRTFMNDRANQTVLGTFVGIFAYCLVVLRTIRGGNEGAFVPPTAVLGGFALALLGVGVLIYFLVHITQSLQAASILDRVRRETEAAVDRLFPSAVGRPAGAPPDAVRPPGPIADDAWTALCAHASGYVQPVDADGLLAFACTRGAVVRMEIGVGGFAVQGAPLASIARSAAPPHVLPVASPDRVADEHALNALYAIRPDRTVEQDVAFGILQLVDIALKALSPGVNDTTTAVTCLGHLSAVLARVARRQFPELVRSDGGAVRVLAVGPTFQGMVAAAFDDVRRNAGGNVTVLGRLIDALRVVGDCTTDPGRRCVLADHVARVAAAAAREVPAPDDRGRLAQQADAARAALAG